MRQTMLLDSGKQSFGLRRWDLKMVRCEQLRKPLYGFRILNELKRSHLACPNSGREFLPKTSLIEALDEVGDFVHRGQILLQNQQPV